MIEEMLLGFIRDLYFDNKEYWNKYKKLKNNDCTELKAIIERNKIQLLFYKYIYEFIPQEAQCNFDQMYFTLLSKNQILFREFLRIKKLFELNNISFALVKGFPLSKLIYDDIYIRVTSDLDILVAEEDIVKAYTCLSSLGYKQQIFYDRRTKKLITSDSAQFKYGDNSHELQCIKPISEDRFLGVEIKRATSAIPLKHIKMFLKSLQKYNVNNFSVASFDISHTYLHLCANAYNNSETYMGVYRGTYIRDYLDIIIFVKRYRKAMDWNMLQKLAVQYEIGFKVYIVMKNCNELLGEELVQDNILELFIDKKCSSLEEQVSWKIPFINRFIDKNHRFVETNNFIKSQILKLHKYDLMPNIEGITLTWKIDGYTLNFFFDIERSNFKKLNYHRIVLLLLNNYNNPDILFSDICLNITDSSISFEYCPISYIQNFENQYTKLEIQEVDSGKIKISIDCKRFMFGNRIFVKLIKQQEIVDRFFARVMLTEGFSFDKHFIEIK